MDEAEQTGGRFVDQPHSRAQGRVGEDAAAAWLAKEGYRIVARNVVNRCGEVDIVATDGDTLCFVEVKARAGGRYGPAVGAVTAHKQRKLSRTAALYLVRHETDRPCRFDVLGMDLVGDEWAFTLVRDAFPAQLG